MLSRQSRQTDIFDDALRGIYGMMNDGGREGSTVCDVPRVELSRWTADAGLVMVNIQAGIAWGALAPIWARVSGVALTIG